MNICDLKDISIIAYDKMSEIYDRQIPDPDGFISFYMKEIGDKPKRVLDVGCGTGRLLYEVAKMGHECLGVDPSAGSLEVANKKLHSFENVSLRQDSLPELNSVKEKFDIILMAGGVFEYLFTTKSQIAALTRLKQLLTSEGKIIMDIAVPSFISKNKSISNYQGSVNSVNYGTLLPSEVNISYDHYHQLMKSVCTFISHDGNKSQEYTYITRYTLLSELKLLIYVTAYKAQIYGDFQKNAVSPMSGNYVVIVENDEK